MVFGVNNGVIIIIGDNMSDNIDIIAELTTRIGQYSTWASKWHNPKVGGYAHKNALSNSKEAQRVLDESKTIGEMSSEEQDDFYEEAHTIYNVFYAGLQNLKNESKGIPSPMPRGGGSRLPDSVTSVYNAQVAHISAALMPAILSIWTVLGGIVRVSQGQGGVSYHEAGKSAQDYCDYLVNKMVNATTKRAYALHAKGFKTEELSNVEFLEENRIFNSLYLTTEEDGTFTQSVIDGVPMFTLGHTMVKPKKTEDNS
tara:strand:- start:522 stop:1289 length:768 start_codon:yes stop_codon:yes gene_type:complete